MRNRLIRMMYGRNGPDSYSRFLTIISFALLVAAMFVEGTLNLVFWVLAVFLLVYSYTRIFSRNLYKRRAENAAYLKKETRFKNFFYDKWQQFVNRKDYRYFKCSGCNVNIRIPRGKGNIIITCPRCRTSFKGKS